MSPGHVVVSPGPAHSQTRRLEPPAIRAPGTRSALLSGLNNTGKSIPKTQLGRRLWKDSCQQEPSEQIRGTEGLWIEEAVPAGP